MPTYLHSKACNLLVSVTACFCLMMGTAVDAAPTSGSSDNGAAAASSTPINIYISDFGIMQWTKELKLGGDLSQAKYRLLPASSGAVGIAVPMPSDAELEALSYAEFRERIRKVVKAKIRAAIREHGTTNFEIQLMQNINVAGYFNSKRQGKVDEFGAAAYSAIGDVIGELEQERHAVHTHSFTLSNGTKVLAANIESLFHNGKLYIEGADLVDGRAMIEPTSRLISVLGERNVRLFATRGDLLAPPNDSIGNFDTIADLKDLHPGIKTYLLTPQPIHVLPTDNHVAILDPEQTFKAQEYIGFGLLTSAPDRILRSGELIRLPGDTGSHDSPWVSKLDAVVNTETHRTGRERLRSYLFRVDKKAAENLLTTVIAYASVLKVAEEDAEKMAERWKKAPHENPARHAKMLTMSSFFRDTPLSEREEVFLQGAKFVKSALSVVDALRTDLKENSYGNHSFLRSHTLEAIGNFGVDQMKFVTGFINNENLPKEGLVKKGIEHLDTIREFTLAISQHIGRGDVNVDIVSHYINGSKALLQAGLKHHGMLTGYFSLLDGLQQIGTAAYKSARGDALTPELLTEYLDGFNSLAWTVLGLTVCELNFECTAAVQTFGTTLAKVLRDVTEPWFTKFFLAINGNGRKVIDQYLDLQKAIIAKGGPLQTISEIYTRDVLKQNGLSDAQIDELDSAVIKRRERLASMGAHPATTSLQSRTIRATGLAPKPVTDERGGIDLGVSAPQIEKHDMSSLTRSVLGGKR